MKDLLVSAGALLLVTVVILLVERLAGILSTYLKRKKTQAEAEGKKAQMIAFSAADQLLTAVTKSTVSKIEATQAAHLREAVKAGEAVRDDLCYLSEDAYDEICATIGQGVRDTLDALMDSSEIYIRNKIEEVLPAIKQEYAQNKAIDEMLMRDIESTKSNIAEEQDEGFED